MVATTRRGVTIDDVSTRDIDDAIWVEKEADGWTVLVSIADVAGVVLSGSEEDLRAHAMVTTKYFARGNSPMLPPHLSEDRLSLWPHEHRQALTVEIHVPLDLGEPTFSLSITDFVSHAKLSYGMVPESLSSSFKPADARTERLASMVRVAADLAIRLLERRRQSGAMALYDLNNGWVTTEEGWLRQLDDHRDAMGYILVQEMMILANSCVAKWAIERDLPVPFRNHTARPSAPVRAELMRQLDEAMQTPIVDLDVLRERVHMLLNKADYGAVVHGHYGLNLPAYLHFTSPIRRYADLIAHRQIRAKLRGEPIPYTHEDVERLCLHINETLRAEDAELKQRAKDKAASRARRMTDARQLAGLYAKEFERVCKTWARATETTPDALAEAFEMRIVDGTVPLVCMAVAFAEAPLGSLAWDRIRRTLLDHFGAKSHDAISVVTMAAQTGHWSLPTTSVESCGPEHALQFRATASWLQVDGTTLEVVHQASSKKRAEQEAAALLLAKRFGMDPPRFAGEPAAPVRSTSAPRKAFVFDPSKDPISLLMEYCQAHRLDPAAFAFEQQGPSHIPSITCTARLLDKQSNARASTKQEAKRAAAVALLAQIRGGVTAPHDTESRKAGTDGA
jgi:ribonuclease R